MVAITTCMEALDVPLDMAGQVGYVGLAAAGLVAVASLARPRRGGEPRAPLPIAGLALAAAGMVAVTVADSPERTGSRQAVGVAAAAVGGFVAARLPWWLRPLLILPGAALVLDSMGLDEQPGVVTPVVILASVLAMLVAETDRVHAATAAGPILMAVSIFGMYVTIPETAQILPVMVVSIPICLMGGPLRLARLGSAGSAATVVLLAAIVAEGGQTRAASIVGGLASLGVLALVPVARALAGRAEPPPGSWRSPWTVQFVALHVLVVLVASRVAGLRETLVAATVIVDLVVLAALFALTVMVRDVERGTSRR